MERGYEDELDSGTEEAVQFIYSALSDAPGHEAEYTALLGDFQNQYDGAVEQLDHAFNYLLNNDERVDVEVSEGQPVIYLVEEESVAYGGDELDHIPEEVEHLDQTGSNLPAHATVTSDDEEELFHDEYTDALTEEGEVWEE